MHGPQRLNLAVARRCFVGCKGCYQLFGAGDPDLEAIRASAGRFAALGVPAATVSGGDPLTIPGLVPFLTSLRASGMRDLKVDTVGTGLVRGRSAPPGRDVPGLPDLLAAVDYLGVPLDGWSNDSVTRFRAGRRRLFDETRELLRELDRLDAGVGIIVNSVAHGRNEHGFERILDEVAAHPSVVHWNVFQYTPTDQVPERVNSELRLDDLAFARLRERLEARVDAAPVTFALAVRSVRSRLGRYLLVNSDGTAWLPDERGRTIRIGSLADGEEALLAAWSSAVSALRARLTRPAPRLRTGAGDLPQLLA